MADPEREHKAPVEEISPRTTLDDIPGGIKCLVCDQPTVKAYVNYRWEGDVTIHVGRAAGYRCPKDRFEYISHEALLEIFTIARKRMSDKGDIAMAEVFDRRIDFRLRAMEESRLLENVAK